jgi:hypothetical protein
VCIVLQKDKTAITGIIQTKLCDGGFESVRSRRIPSSGRILKTQAKVVEKLNG